MQRLATIAPPQVHEIWALLSQIPDPEIPVLTITDLGMVRNVTQMGEGWVIGFTPTYSGCPATEHLIGAIREAMTTHGFTPVQVVLQLDPAWTTDWMTPDAREHIRQGMTLEVMVPQGHFGYQPQAERQGRYLAIAAGSGITPMLAIIATTLQTEPESQFTLIYGNRTSQSMMFRQALADLKDKYPQRLQLLCIFSQETLDSDLLHGRIDGERLQSLGASLINFRLYDEAFICGPAAMMDETEAALKALGMPDKTIHLERFNTPGTRVKRSVNVQSDGQKVTVRQDGRDREIVLNADDESILDAALRQGADLPYACKGGVCATCKCKVLRGKVAMETNYSLEPDELAAGYVLSCQALPLTSDVVVDFDAKGMA